MITSSDTGLILYDDCKRLFALDTFLKDTNPKGEVKTERVVIYPKEQTKGDIWVKNFIEVNLCVPDVGDGEAGSVRLQELEREAHSYFDKPVFGEYDGTTYYYSADTIGIREDSQLKCHFVNVKILFNTFKH